MVRHFCTHCFTQTPLIAGRGCQRWLQTSIGFRIFCRMGREKLLASMACRLGCATLPLPSPDGEICCAMPSLRTPGDESKSSTSCPHMCTRYRQKLISVQNVVLSSDRHRPSGHTLQKCTFQMLHVSTLMVIRAELASSGSVPEGRLFITLLSQGGAA